MKVSILILLDDALEALRYNVSCATIVVSILILLDDALEDG